jgi:hypothetical protein
LPTEATEKCFEHGLRFASENVNYGLAIGGAEAEILQRINQVGEMAEWLKAAVC